MIKVMKTLIFINVKNKKGIFMLLKCISKALCILMLTIGIFSPTLVYADIIYTGSLGRCIETVSSASGVFSESAKLNANRMTLTNDANGSRSFRCLMNMRSDVAIKNVQINFTVDQAAKVATKDLEPDDDDIQYYLPKCRLEITYSPGGNDYVYFSYKKGVPWGHYSEMYLDEATLNSLDYNGNGYLQNAILQCSSAYYTEYTNWMGIRFYYEEK